MSSRPLPSDPSDREELSRWIAEGIDAQRPRRPIGRNWKHRVLGGQSVHQLMSTARTATEYHFRVSMEEAIVVARVVARSNLNRNAFLRRALAHWLITKEGVNPDSIPRLAKHL